MKRLLVISGVLMIVALAGGYAYFARQPVYRVTGPSMAPALLGPHYKVTCPECDHRFPIDATRGPIPTATCDYCGAIAPVNTGDIRPGDAIDVITGKLERFDLVMFSDPDDPQQRVVKRVVGLPGETVECRDGDLWIDGQRYQKSWDEFARVAIPVYEIAGPPELSPPHLTKTPDGWIAYHHQVHSQGVQLAGAAPPLDDYPYNQGLPGKLRPIVDIGLSCRWNADAPLLEIAFAHRDGQWVKRLIRDDSRPSGLQAAPLQTYADDEIPQVETAIAAHGGTRLIVLNIAVCDGRLITSWDNSVLSIDSLVESPYELTATPILLQSGGDGRIEQLKVLRDIHYADFPETKIPADTYFVLGDNVPLSRDSRHFGAIPANSAVRVAPASRPD